MANDLDNKLSGEQLATFNRNVSKLEALEERRQRTAKEVLKLEREIGELRIGFLDQYFDEYSNRLDKVVAKKLDEIPEGFLVLEKILENFTDKFTATTSEFKSGSSAGANSTSSGGSSTPPGGNSTSGGGYDPLNASHGSGQTMSEESREKGNEQPSATNFLDSLKVLSDIADEEERILKMLGEAKEEQGQANKLTEIRNTLLAEANTKSTAQLDDYKKAEAALYLLRQNDAELQQAMIAEMRASKLTEGATAELDYQKKLNTFNATNEFIKGGPNAQFADEQAAARLRKDDAEANSKALGALDEARTKRLADLEYKYRRANNGKLDAEGIKAIQAQVAEEFDLRGKGQDKLDKLLKKQQKEKDNADRQERLQAIAQATDTIFSKGKTLEERKEAFKSLAGGEDATTGDYIKAGLEVATKALSNLVQKLETSIDQIAAQKGDIDTRLQGSNNETFAGSYWDQITKDIMSVGAVTPYFKQEDFAKNIKDLVDRGIAFDLEQRAFLMTIQNKIANTFNAADGTLLRLIRLQQEDSTAGRLGMESALNAFLNEMYENTEYLKGVAESVRGSLQEMEALMTGAEATEVEFQVQKWMGSLYSVGMSQEAVQNIAGTLGKIAAGQIDGLTGGNGAGNLLVMAANSSGKSIADILTDGLDSTETNNLLQAAVNYLASLAESSKGNNVVQQQLANVFGVKASDLRAATNLVLPGTINNVYESSMTYNNMVDRLITMADSMGDRMSMAEKLSNIWANGQYTIAGSMASTPAAYVLSKVATLLQDTTGGIPLPFLNVMGFGVDLETTVADLMRVGAIGTGILGSFGSIISGLGNSFSGRSMLEQMGIKEESGLVITPRGDGSKFINSIGGGAKTTSGSGTIAGNASGSDIKDSTIQEANDSKKQQMIEAKEEAEANQVDMLNSTVLKIYELLYDVAQGNSSLRVRVDSYGLTKVGSSSAMGGLDGALSNSTSTSGGGSLGSSGAGISYSESGSVSSGGARGGVDFGGWTTA